MFAFFAKSRAVQICTIAIAILVLVFALDRCAKHLTDGLQESAASAGRQQERARTLETNLTRTMEAQNAAETILRDTDARRTECLRDARNPANC